MICGSTGPGGQAVGGAKTRGRRGAMAGAVIANQASGGSGRRDLVSATRRLGAVTQTPAGFLRSLRPLGPCQFSPGLSVPGDRDQRAGCSGRKRVGREGGSFLRELIVRNLGRVLLDSGVLVGTRRGVERLMAAGCRAEPRAVMHILGSRLTGYGRAVPGHTPTGLGRQVSASPCQAVLV